MDAFISKHFHWGGKLGFYKGNPTTVGSAVDQVDEYHEMVHGGNNKVETLLNSNFTGWSSLTDFPQKLLKNKI